MRRTWSGRGTPNLLGRKSADPIIDGVRHVLAV